MKLLLLLSAFILGLLCSCSSTPSISNLNEHDLRNFKLSDLRRNTPPIVDVKKGSLQKHLSGKDRYLAWRRSSSAPAFGAFFKPKNFSEGDIPANVGAPSTGLLPPLTPGANSSISIDGDLEELSSPDDQENDPAKTN